MKCCKRILREDTEHVIDAYTAHFLKTTREIILCSDPRNPELINVKYTILWHDLR